MHLADGFLFGVMGTSQSPFCLIRGHPPHNRHTKSDQFTRWIQAEAVPAAHLHQCVGLLGPPRVSTDGQTLDCEAATQLGSADEDLPNISAQKVQRVLLVVPLSNEISRATHLWEALASSGRRVSTHATRVPSWEAY